MLYDLVVPAPAEEADSEEFRVLEWHRTEGQAVEEGVLLVEIETAKSIVEVRAGQAAVLRKIATPAGEWQRFGQPIALLTDAETEAVDASATANGVLRADFQVV